MNSLPDPSFFLQLSESFIKAARLDTSGEKPRLTAMREISSAQLASQPNPIVQIAGEGCDLPVPVAVTLSLGETVYHAQSFDQIGFSTLTEFIGQQNPTQLYQYELGVFQRANGMPAPTASPAPLELVFCGFNSNALPELSDAFPNLDAEAISITLAPLDQFRFLRSQCKDDEQILLVNIGNDRTHLFLIGNEGVVGIKSIDLGHHALYEVMAEVLHLHYIGSAIKLFTRSGFDSSELAPKLGTLFGTAIQSLLAAEDWSPSSVQIGGLLHAQLWFQEAILSVLGLKAFQIDHSLLPFDIDDSLSNLSSLDTEILAKVFASLTLEEDFSWHNDYLNSLNKSNTIPRREPGGSNPPFPTAHPDRLPPPTPVEVPESVPPEPEPISAYAPPQAPVAAPLENPAPPPQAIHPSPPAHKDPLGPRKVEAIPDHVLSDIEEYEGEFEDLDDYGGGRGRLVIKAGLLAFSLLIIGVMITVVFFPKASEKYLGIRPPHIDFDESDPDPISAMRNGGDSSAYAAPVDVTSGLQDLRLERKNVSFGGLYLPTNPNGATVIVGDLSPKISPIKLPNVEPGTYDVVISKEGYETLTMRVTIEPKEVKKIDTVYLKRLR
jgi:hypothetical protein